MREGLLPVPGGRVFYRIIGQDAPGVPLLVLHGGPGIPHDYLEPLGALASKRPVVFYDQLGCGGSDRPDDLSLSALPRFVEELAAVRRGLGLERVHLLGQSWGCMLAVEYMLEMRPSGVLGLVLCGPCLDSRRFALDQRVHLEHMPPAAREAIRAAEESGDFSSPGYQAAIMEYYKKHVCRLDPWPECLDRAVERMNPAIYGHMWGPSEFTCLGTLKDHGRAEELGSIGVPVLFTCGRLDEARPETVEEYRARIPGAELRVFEDASHEHHLEQPEAFLAEVAGFLRRAESRATNGPNPLERTEQNA